MAVAGPVKNIEERIKTMMKPGKKFYKRPSLITATAVLLLALLTVPTALVLTAYAGEEWKKPESGTIVSCSGKVVNTKGEPVAGVRVRLYALRRGWISLTSPHAWLLKEVRTKTDGTFYFTADPGSMEVLWLSRIVAEKEGLAMNWRYWSMKEDEKVEIKLGEPKKLSGVVVDENGKPIVGAQVSIWELMAGEIPHDRILWSPVALKVFSVRTDPAGKFSFDNLPGGTTADLLVRKAGRATVITIDPESPCYDKLQLAPGQKDIRIEMPRESRIEGILVEKDSSKPVAKVKVQVMEEQPPNSRPRYGRIPWHEQVTSKADGTFGVSALPGGKYFLQVMPSGDWTSELVEVTTEAGKTKSGLKVEVSKRRVQDFTATDAATKKRSERKIAGVVRDEEGEPVGHAKIRFMRRSGLSFISGADAAGRFEVTGQVVYLVARDEEGKLAAAAEVEEGTETLDVKLKPAVLVRGKVVDPDGKGIGRAEINIWSSIFPSETANLEGDFEIRAMPAESKYVMYVWAEGYGEVGTEVDTHDAVDNRLALDPLVLPLANLSVSGVVVDAEDQPVSGAYINAMDEHWLCRQARTDAEGRFKIDRICKGKVDINAYKGDKRGRLKTEAVARNVRIVLTERWDW